MLGKLGLVNNRMESGVSAMIRPVGVNNPQFCITWHPSLLLAKIFLAKSQVAEIHGQAEAGDHLLKATVVQLEEAIEQRHIGRSLSLNFQALRLGQRCLAAFNWIDQMIFDLFNLLG